MGASLTNYASQRPSPPDLWIWFSDSLNCIIFCSIAGCHKWTQECALYDQFDSIFPNRPFLFSSSNISKHLFPFFSNDPKVYPSSNVTSIKFRDEFVTKSRRENTRLKGGKKTNDDKKGRFFFFPFLFFFLRRGTRSMFKAAEALRRTRGRCKRKASWRSNIFR